MENLSKYLIALRYRWKLAAGVAVLVSVSLSVVVWFLPNEYSANTTILVDPQKIPDKYVSATVTEDANERLNTLTQEVLSRTRLSSIVAQYNLYPGKAAKEGEDAVIAYLKSHIKIEVKKTTGAALSAFTITYRANDRFKVAPVTNRLAQSFIDWNLEQRQSLVEGTTKFLNDELDQARQRLQVQEARVRDYRLGHLGQMPEQMTANLQTLGRLQLEQQAKADALNRIDQERLALLQTPGGELALEDHHTYVSPRTQLVAQIAQANRHLEELLAKYKPQHPDVIAAQDHLHELQAQLDAMGSDTNPPIDAQTAGSDRSARLQLLNRQRDQIVQQEAALEQQVRHYQQLVDAVPVREAEVSGLMRDYESAKANYQSLLEKSYSADLATELERKQQGEKFQVLDQAITPDRPDSPNRPVFWFGAFLAGLAAGLGAVIGLEQINGIVRTEADLLALLPKGATIIGQIPNIRTIKSVPGVAGVRS